MPTTRPRTKVEHEIRDTLGLVPSFFDRVPDEVFDHEWTLFKHYEFDETLIPNKYRELMGVALHAGTHCRYCTLCHTEAARLFGATDDEIQEAVHYARHSMGWSIYLDGIQQDHREFAREVERTGAHGSLSGWSIQRKLY